MIKIIYFWWCWQTFLPHFGFAWTTATLTPINYTHCSELVLAMFWQKSLGNLQKLHLHLTSQQLI